FGTSGKKVCGRRGSAGLAQVSTFQVDRKYLSQAVRDSWDKSTWRTRTARIGRNRELQSGTVGTKGRMGREKPKEPRANQILPRVLAAKRDKEARIGWFGDFCPRQFGTSRPKGREGREKPGGPQTNQETPCVLRWG
ncbi:hypothetical protein KI387_030017, partial [Taxus chinensis]